MVADGKRKARETKIKEALVKKDYRVLIGEMLRRQRESLDISQRQIGERSGIDNFNFISMIESGINTVPFARIPEFVSAYELDPVFVGVLVKFLYPDTWAAVCAIHESVPHEIMNSPERDILIESACSAALKEFRIAA